MHKNIICFQHGDFPMVRVDKANAKQQSITMIKDLNTFAFEDKGIIRCWRAGKLGVGMEFKVTTPVELTKKFNYKLILPEQISDGKTKKDLENGAANRRTHIQYHTEGTREVASIKSVDDPDDLVKEIKASEMSGEPIRHGATFRCPNDLCDAKFLNYSNYLLHEISQNCYRKTQQSIAAHVIREYCSKMGAAGLQRRLTPSEKKHMATNVLEEMVNFTVTDGLLKYIDIQNIEDHYRIGFALRTRTKPTEYNSKQLEYIKAIFLEGEKANK